MKAEIGSALTIDELKAIKARIQAMEPKDQAALAAVFQAKVTELKK